jgi:hypothetical protein
VHVIFGGEKEFFRVHEVGKILRSTSLHLFCATYLACALLKQAIAWRSDLTSLDLFYLPGIRRPQASSSSHRLWAEYGTRSAEDVEEWHRLEMMHELQGPRGKDAATVPQRFTSVSNLIQLQKLLLDNLDSNPAQAEKKFNSMFMADTHKALQDALYRILFPIEGEPIYMPSVALSIYWPDSPRGSEGVLPCLVALATEHQSVVLDLLRLGARIAEKEVEVGNVAYNVAYTISETFACVKSLELVQKVLEDHTKRINIITWDGEDLLLAQKQLLAGQHLTLPVVGNSVQACSRCSCFMAQNNGVLFVPDQLDFCCWWRWGA